MATRLLKISSALRTYSNKTSLVKVKLIIFYNCNHRIVIAVLTSQPIHS